MEANERKCKTIDAKSKKYAIKQIKNYTDSQKEKDFEILTIICGAGKHSINKGNVGVLKQQIWKYVQTCKEVLDMHFIEEDGIILIKI